MTRPMQDAKHHPIPRLLAMAAALQACGLASAQTTEAAMQPMQLAQSVQAVQSVLIVGSAPLPGSDLRRDQIAAPVQTARASDLADTGALSPADLLRRRFGSVLVNEVQGNPFQPDVSYRGFSASPLLGTAQGLSVYLDGLRLNQPFGDVVSWDLIPRSAISTISLMPGSNPLFGFNTLGGALALRTKDGLHDRGTQAELSAGSHGRWQAEIETGGGEANSLSWYGNATRFQEHGWREQSPSDVNQLFAKLGLPIADTQTTLTLAHAESRLVGNGLQEQSLLAAQRSSVYTVPDETRNRASLLQLALKAEPSAALSLSAQGYWRRIDSRTLNGDVNEESLDQSLYTLSAADKAALSAAGIAYPASITAQNTPFPSLRCIAQSLSRDEPGEKCNGLLTRGHTLQQQAGLGLQAGYRWQQGSVQHRLLAGAAFDRSRVHYQQMTQLGYLNADRSVTGVDAFADGVNGGDMDGEPLDTAVDLRSHSRSSSLYAADTLSLPGGWQLNLSLRHDRLVVHSRDQRRSAPDPASLDGDHRFAHTNPALGLLWQASPALQLYAGANQGSRAPSAIELGCANPEQPCKLPNAMAGDPPLKQVVTRTLEAGVRGRIGDAASADAPSWQAGVFRADSRDDLLFVADDIAGYGYFRNFGRTRRQGLELGANARIGTLAMSFNYTWLQATYRSAETVNGAGNSSNNAGPGLEGTISILPGDRLPLLPRQIAKLSLRWQATSAWSIDLDAQAQSGMLARGNENNAHQPDGTIYLGPGRSAGYAVVNLGSRWQATPALQLFLQVTNLFDRQYDSAAQLGATAFDAQGRFVARPLPRTASGEYPLRGSTFHAPGAPRAISLGLRWQLR